MVGGRRPNPTRLSELRGTYAKDPGRRNRSEPVVPTDRPDCPPHLVGVARRAFEDVCDQLELIGILTSVDFVALSLFAKTYATWRDACDKCDKLGDALVVPIFDTEGNRCGVDAKRNPFHVVKSDAARQLHKLCREFGLTPSARVQVHINENAATLDPFADFFKSRESKN
jgi:P27 family predicted phage terminase small subunit